MFLLSISPFCFFFHLRIKRTFSVSCLSIHYYIYTLMDTSLRRSNFITSFIENSIFCEFSTIIWVRRFTIRVSFGWVQSDDYWRNAREPCIVDRTLIIALFVIISRGTLKRPTRIGLHLLFIKIHNSRQCPSTVTFSKFLKIYVVLMMCRSYHSRKFDVWKSL